MLPVFTHHQKTVVVDAEIADSDKRRLVGFIGGVDLTDGRFDTPEFPLFRYQESHGCDGEDFYQGCTKGATAGTGPRQPWQDIHARVEGPAVRDILENFSERWRKQAADKTPELMDVTQLEDVFDFGNVEEDDEDQGQSPWSVQILRSATSDSCEFHCQKRERGGMLIGKSGTWVDNSIFKYSIIA